VISILIAVVVPIPVMVVELRTYWTLAVAVALNIFALVVRKFDGMAGAARRQITAVTS
jgi:hypothetical protein